MALTFLSTTVRAVVAESGVQSWSEQLWLGRGLSWVGVKWSKWEGAVAGKVIFLRIGLGEAPASNTPALWASN